MLRAPQPSLPVIGRPDDLGEMAVAGQGSSRIPKVGDEANKKLSLTARARGPALHAAAGVGEVQDSLAHLVNC